MLFLQQDPWGLPGLATSVRASQDDDDDVDDDDDDDDDELVMMMMMMIILISARNPIRNPNDYIYIWLIVPWHRGIKYLLETL